MPCSANPLLQKLGVESLLARGPHPALVDAAGCLSYRELGQAVAAVRDELVRVGVRPGEPVALASETRGRDETVGLLAALAAGATVVPIDASAPAARLSAILGPCGARLAIIDAAAKGLRDRLREASSEIEVLGVEEHGSPAPGCPPLSGAAPTPPGSEPIACVLHTSGSTGTPKPIPITTAGLSAFATWTADLIGLGEDDRVLRIAELTFDLAWFDHIATLSCGATLLLPSRREIAVGRALVSAFEALAPTVVYGVPSLFQKIDAAMPEPDPLRAPLRAVFFAGEVFTPSGLRSFAQRVPNARLFNFYGPTETNVCTYHEVDRAALDGESEIPIGVPCPYATCTVRDESGAELVGACTGELWVEGVTTMGGGPLATRDRVLRDDTGVLFFRGRIDRMVKIRGYRVEPGDVEAALAHHPQVAQCAVVPYDDAKLGRCLAAFVEPTDELGVAARDLRKHVSKRVPSYMVPDRVVVVPALPRNANGKIDYGALVQQASS